jgi:eukaryotic-like serine/threonine-protein kinase
MAPEYLMGQGSDARADIYALGVVLFELVTGRKPFQADNEVLLMQAVLNTPVPDVRTLRADVPPELVRVISRALAKNRGQRYQSCREMSADVEQFLFRCGEPVGALQLGELVSLLNAVPPAETPRALPEGTARKTIPMGINASPAPLESPQPPVASAAVPQVEKGPAPASQRAVTRVTVPKQKTSKPPTASPTPHGRQRTYLQWSVPTAVVMMLAGTGYVALRNPDASTKEQVPSHQETVPPAPVEHTAPPAPQTDGGSVLALQASPDVGAASEEEDAGETPALEQASPAQPSAQTTLRVSSNLPGQVRINGRLVGQPPLVQEVEPGRLNITISGSAQGYRFDKSRVVELRAQESQEVMFSIQKVNVTIRGRPDDLRAVAMDDRTLEEGVQTVTTYEGRHRLKLIHPPTGKTYTSECQVKPGDKFCKFSVALK